MAIIEGVGDEVTILFGLVFIVLVLVLAWASTRTVDRGDQALQTAEDISASTSEQEVLSCTSTNQSPREGETIAKRTDAGCTAEEIEESADEKEEQSTGYTAEEIEESADEKEEQSEDEKEEQRTGCTAEEIEESEDEKEEQSEDEEREQQSEEAEERKQSEEERKQSEEQQEGEKGVEVEEEFRTKHETPPAEKGAEELVTDNVSEMDISPLDTMELRQRVTCTSGREETVSADVQPPDSDCAEGSSILLRLKFLNDTERIARVRPEDTIGQIKRIHFPHQEHQVRLIYQGQLLGDDTRTLSSLHIVNNCVVHCHISQNATPQSPAGSHAAEHTETTLNIGGLMLPVFFLMLSVLWYYQINYRQFFTAPATISLVGITILFSFVAFGAYRR